jgi:hypothetical protein
MVRAARSATTARTDHIVGRAEQRAQLSRALDDVIDDGSRFVIIGGDAGAGQDEPLSMRSLPICSVSWPIARRS